MDKIIKENFFATGCNGDVALRTEDLGWPQALIEESRSYYSETIFRYVIEIAGFNLLFYWTKDEQFYVIETEKDPIEVRRIAPNPNWDGKCEFFKAASNFGPNTASPGEVLAKFDNPTEVWDKLQINDVPISEVIEESMIITWD